MSARKPLSDADVAWLTPVLGRGGQLLYLGPLLTEFARRCRRFCVFTAAPAEVAADRFDVAVVGATARISTRRVRDGRANLDAAGAGLVSPGVIPELARYRPELVVLNEFGLQSIYGALYAKWVRPRPAVLLIAETRPRFEHNHRWLVAARMRLRRTLVRTADAVLTNNDAGREYLRDLLGVDEDRIIARPYLVSDMQALGGAMAARPHRHAGGPIRFLFVGRLVQLKGIQFAIEACATLVPDYAGRFVFDVVGEGPYRRELEERARALGVADHVRFHGAASYDDIARRYAGADVFVFPTLSDYRALVTFEALSAGLPLLVSIHDGGVGETVADGDNGFRFDPRAPQVLAGFMRQFIDDPGLVARFSSRSLDRARAFRLPAAVDALVQASELALARRSSPGESDR